MKMNVRDDSKIVDIWLTKKEKENQDLREQLQPLYKEYKAKKYLVAVFESGEEDLWDNTSQLLCTNRRRMAERETEQEKQMDDHGDGDVKV